MIEEPDASIAHVRICGGPGRVIARSTRPITLDNILITYNILGDAKISRLRALADQVYDLAVVADNDVVLKGLSESFSGAARDLDVLIECDTGAGRCGVQTPEQAVSLAKTIDRLPGLHLRGLMTYPAPYHEETVQTWFSETAALAADAGIKLAVFSSGGTPSMWELAKAPIVNEYRIGTYVYQDRSRVAAGACETKDCALTVLAMVISTPVPGRVIIDAGSKALTSDLLGQTGFGQVVGFPDAQVVALSEEHGILNVPAGAKQPALGDRVQIIPNHACPVSNLFDEVHFVRAGRWVHTQAVAARGKVS